MKRSKFLFALPAVLALALVPALDRAGADGDDHPIYPLSTYPPSSSDNAVLVWNEEALQCIRSGKPGPTVVARALFVAQASVYNAWSAYDAKAVPTIRSGFVRRRGAGSRCGCRWATRTACRRRR